MIQKMIDAYELEREMYRKCIDTDEEIDKGRAKWDSGLWIRYKVFEDAIALAPTVDAEPVRHGRWIMEFDEKTMFTDWRCTACGKYGRGDYKRCPWCGAKMDEVTE